MGFVLDRVKVSWVYAIAFLLWSAATAATGLASGFAVLLTLRLLLGVGESAAYPCYSKTFATYYPEHHRGLANGLIDAGSKFGPALGFIATVMIFVVPYDREKCCIRQHPVSTLEKYGPTWFIIKPCKIPTMEDEEHI